MFDSYVYVPYGLFVILTMLAGMGAEHLLWRTIRLVHQVVRRKKPRAARGKLIRLEDERKLAANDRS